MTALQFEEAFATLRREIQQHGSSVFQEALDAWLLSNTHRVLVHLEPDKAMNERVLAQERERMAAVRARLTEAEVADIVRESEALKTAQLAEDSAAAKATIPKLLVSDVSAVQDQIPIRLESLSDSLPLIVHELNTNGVVYVDIAFDYSRVLWEDLPWLPLFTKMLMETSTATYSESELQQEINRKTGGIYLSYVNAMPHAGQGASDPHDMLNYLVMRGKTLLQNIPALTSLMEEIMLRATFDDPRRVMQHLKEIKASKESSVLTNALSYATTRIASKSSALGELAERTSGVTFLQGLDRMIQQTETDFPGVVMRLERIRGSIFRRESSAASCATRPPVVLNVAASASLLTHATLSPSLNALVAALPTTPLLPDRPPSLHAWSRNTSFFPRNEEVFVIPTQVNFVAQGQQLFSHASSKEAYRKGSYAVVCKYLSTDYLWNRVRVVGGAYGSGSSFGAASGRLVLTSYRDPHVLNTLRVFDETASHLQSKTAGDNALTESDIQQLIIGAIGDLDSPMSPDQKSYASMVQFLRGETPEDRQRYREEVLGTTIHDFRSLAERMAAVPSTAVVFGQKDKVAEAVRALEKTQRHFSVTHLLSEETSQS